MSKMGTIFGMGRERCGHPRLLLEAGDDPRVLREMIDQHLDGEEAAMQPMAGQIDLRHAAAADAAEDVIFVSQYFAADDPVARPLPRLFPSQRNPLRTELDESLIRSANAERQLIAALSVPAAALSKCWSCF